MEEMGSDNNLSANGQSKDKANGADTERDGAFPAGKVI